MNKKPIDLRFQYDEEIVEGMFFTADIEKILENLKNQKIDNEILDYDEEGFYSHVQKNGYSVLTYYLEDVGWTQWRILKRCDINEFIEMYSNDPSIELKTLIVGIQKFVRYREPNKS